MKPRKVTFHSNAFPDALAMFKATEKNFTVTRTNYTAQIETPTGRYFFADDPIAFYLFPIADRVKRDVIAKGIPEVAEEAVKYYGFGKATTRDTLPSKAWSIDLTSAYANALHNLGLISGDTFTKLDTLKKKKDRLRVVGMLATTKAVIQYHRERVQEIQIVRSPTRSAFFAACAEVGRLMEATESHPGHLFFWVDGVFFDRPAEDVSEYFTGQGYPSKVEEISALRFSTSKRFLFYDKGERTKYLSIPQGKRPSAEWITELLNQTQQP